MIDVKILPFTENSLATYYAAEELLVLQYSTLPSATDQGLVLWIQFDLESIVRILTPCNSYKLLSLSHCNQDVVI